MSAIVVKLPVRRGPGVNAIPARPEPARVIDLATYRRSRRSRRVRSAHPARLRPPRLQFEDDDDERSWEAGAHEVIDAAEALLAAGRHEDVLEFCARAAACLGRSAAAIGDARAVVGLTTRLGELRARASGG